MPPVFQIPALLMFETIVSLGVGFFAHAMAKDYVRRPGVWGVGAVAVSFAIHRFAELIISQMTLDLVFASSGARLLGMVAPFSGTIAVFILTPLVLPRLLPNIPWQLRNQAADDSD